MQTNFTNEQYLESIQSLVAGAVAHPYYGETLKGILQAAMVDETTFVRVYALFHPSLKTVDEVGMAYLLTNYFEQTPLSEFNQHILAEWSSFLNKDQRIALRVSQNGNPFIDDIISESFRTEEQWLDFARLLLDKEEYAKSKQIFDTHVALKKMPTKVKTVAGVLAFLDTASDKHPAAFTGFLNDYPWAGEFILVETNAKLTGKFLNLADDKHIVRALENDQLKMHLGKFKEKLLKPSGIYKKDNDGYVECLVHYALDFAIKMNNPEKMPLALTFLDLLRKNIPSFMATVSLKEKSGEDFIEFMERVNNLDHKHGTSTQSRTRYGDFDAELISQWNKQKNWMKLDRVAKDASLSNKQKNKI